MMSRNAPRKAMRRLLLLGNQFNSHRSACCICGDCNDDDAFDRFGYYASHAHHTARRIQLI